MSEAVTRRVRASRSDPLTVGIDVGGTKVLGAVVDATGAVVAALREHDFEIPLQFNNFRD